MRPLPYALALALLSACAVQTVRRSADSGPEASQQDAGPDASATACGACAPRLVCDASSKQCVQCTSAKDCLSGSCMSDQRCAPCSGNDDCNGGFCERSQCVQCRSESDCGLTAPVCSGGRCERCDSHADCEARTATPACDKGACVRCAADKVTACDVDAPYCSSENDCVRCLENAQCPAEDPQCSANSCVACGGNADCMGRTDVPVCDSVSGDCVECTATDAAKCTADSKVCKTGASVCVQCNEKADCKSADASRCLGNACASCQADADCVGIMAGGTALDACLNGKCVDCRIDATNTKVEHGCAANFACNPANNTCTNRPKDTATICQPCLADSECKADHRCVAMTFNGSELKPVEGGGGYCLKRVGTGPCDLPYGANPAINRPSLSGAAAEAYCSVNEARTTCDAVLQYAKPCPSCAGMAGARCESVGVIGNRCTYSCSSGAVNECPESSSCPSGAASYCGQN